MHGRGAVPGCEVDMRLEPRATVLALLLSIMVSGPLAAQEEPDDDAVNVVEEGDRKVLYKAKTEISFEGVDVEGEIKKPTGSYLLERRKAKFSSLIKFRTDFDKEMLRSVHEIK